MHFGKQKVIEDVKRIFGLNLTQDTSYINPSFIGECGNISSRDYYKLTRAITTMSPVQTYLTWTYIHRHIMSQATKELLRKFFKNNCSI